MESRASTVPTSAASTLGPELDYRRGLLGKGSFLSITFTQNFRTSPVKRGVWILENILGSPAPAPPPNVPALEDSGGDDGRILTLREQMTLHRQNGAVCNVPQADGSDRFCARELRRGWELANPAGRRGGNADRYDRRTAWDGAVVTGPVELREALLRYTPQFVRTVTKNMMTYALGRGVEYIDMPVIRSIVRGCGEATNTGSGRSSWVSLRARSS